MRTTLSSLRAEVEARSQLPDPAECKAIRLRDGVSLRQVAETCGVTDGAAHHWESGRARPSGRHLIKYLEALRIMREATS